MSFPNDHIMGLLELATQEWNFQGLFNRVSMIVQYLLQSIALFIEFIVNFNRVFNINSNCLSLLLDLID